MEEFYKVANQFGLSVALMLGTIVALGYWIVKRTVPKELHDFQVENLTKQFDKLNSVMEKLSETSANNVTTLGELNRTIDAQNKTLAEVLKHIEVMRYAISEGGQRKK